MAGSASRPLRLVLDTNIVVAGLLWNGAPRRLLEAAIGNRPTRAVIDGRSVQMSTSGRSKPNPTRQV
jgi:hypothetical protein